MLAVPCTHTMPPPRALVDNPLSCRPCACQIHETVPQALLPLMPLLREELEAEGDGGRRAAAVDLVARLFTQNPSGGAIINEYEPLLYALLGRGSDAEVGGRGAAVMGCRRRACRGMPSKAAGLLQLARRSPTCIISLLAMYRSLKMQNEVRRKLLAYMPALLEVCEGQEARAAAVVRSLVERLYDPDEGGSGARGACTCSHVIIHVIIHGWLI